MTPSPAEVLALLCDLGDHIREAVVGSRHIDMSAVEGRTRKRTPFYAIDRVADDAVAWFADRWEDVEVVSEGLEEPLVLGYLQWTVIVDSIDGTRGLMYDKRPAWALCAAAPYGGSLRDVVAASMTELPTVKQTLAELNPRSVAGGHGTTPRPPDRGNGGSGGPPVIG